MAVAAGCQPNPVMPPKAGVGDPAVFTSLHLLATEAILSPDKDSVPTGLLQNGPFTAAEMRRYFESSEGDYANKRLRMDAMLDGTQRFQSAYQKVKTQFSVDLAAKIAADLIGKKPADASSSSTGSGTKTGDTKNDGAKTGDAKTDDTKASDAKTDDAKTAETKATGTGDGKTPDAAAGGGASEPTIPADAAVIDSPFDQLDRVADYFAAYVVKNLRVRGDSRVVDPTLLTELLARVLSDQPNPQNPGNVSDRVMFAGKVKEFSTSNIPADGKGRLLLLVFQSHVDPGNMPDVWTGARIRVTGVTTTTGRAAKPDDVHIVRLHPTRTYDVDQASTGRDLSDEVSVKVSGSGTASGIDVTATVEGKKSDEQKARERYLSRISKATSFADASEHLFGFNFYPSNIKIDPKNPLDVHGYLEGGARDCAAIVVVPRDLTSITLAVRSVWGNIEDGGENDPGIAQEHPFTVSLPDWNGLELAAATIGAAPTSRPSAVIEVKAVDPTAMTDKKPDAAAQAKR